MTMCRIYKSEALRHYSIYLYFIFKDLKFIVGLNHSSRTLKINIPVYIKVYPLPSI